MDLPQSLGDEFDEFLTNDETEDELKITVSDKDNQVIVSLSKPMTWFSLEPSEALDLGRAIITRAMEMSKKSIE